MSMHIMNFFHQRGCLKRMAKIFAKNAEKPLIHIGSKRMCTEKIGEKNSLNYYVYDCIIIHIFSEYRGNSYESYR